MFKEDYQPEDYGVALREGEYTAVIKEARERRSKIDLRMIEVIMEIEGARFFHYLVEGEYFNRNVTRFFNTFSIPFYNFEYAEWLGKTGIVEISKGAPKADGKVYMEIKKLIPSTANQSAPTRTQPPNQYAPSRPMPPPNQYAPSDKNFFDDVPF